MIIASIAIDYVIHSPEEEQEISHIGGIHPNGIPWRISVARAVRAIDDNEWKFHLLVDGVPKDVVAVKVRGGSNLLGIIIDNQSQTIKLLSEAVQQVSNLYN